MSSESLGESGNRPGLIEELAVGQVPADQRYGKPSSLFFVWFASSLSIATVVLGPIVIYIGNNLFWAIMAIVVGNWFGAAFMAAHSAQGPILGVPQLIQSRGQFGYYLGAWLPVILSFFMYVGFWSFGAIIAAQSVQAGVGGGLDLKWAILILGLASLVVAILGYKYIHWTQRISTGVVILAIAIFSVAVFRHGGFDWSTDGFSAAPWGIAVAIVATYQIGFGPYVSDYSRYLPARVGYWKPFWWSYVGTALAGSWVMGLGALLTAAYPDLTTVEAIQKLMGNGALEVYVLIALGVAVIGINAINLYGSMLSILTAASSFTNRVRKGRLVRTVTILITFAIAIAIAWNASADFLANYQAFLTVLVYVMLPWSTINLVDFYIVKHGHYDVDAFFDRHGIYVTDIANRTRWGVNFNAAIAYVVGIILEVPFMATPWFTGWWVDNVGGADIAWIFGLIVPGPIYYVLAKNARVSESLADAEAVAAGVKSQPEG